ncbi:MAG TPA: TetR/AcrR family transcriptional regulator [Verrucomicrobiae bacterium]|nr:TetR/AcrR family transcriptional regulator [Verrucomicrobiae bacterium]
MSPRAYHLGRRQEQVDESRRRVITAARGLLAETTRYSSFTVDAVATRADVARATVYYQFQSKTGLLEALCDALAEIGRMSDLALAFSLADPIDAVSAFIASFGRFWAVDRLVMRRLRSLAALDDEVSLVIAARDQRRRSGLEVLVSRANHRGLLAIEAARALPMLVALSSFETFDALATPDQPLDEVTPEVLEMARVVWRSVEESGGR